jgi:Putative peptidoglycan binding domain
MKLQPLIRQMSLVFILIYFAISQVHAGFFSDLVDKIKKTPAEDIIDTVDKEARSVGTNSDSRSEKKSFNNDHALVMSTQKELKRLGYYISVDGLYGPGTRKAISQFQQSKSMMVTGDVSTKLIVALKSSPTPISKQHVSSQQQVTDQTADQVLPIIHKPAVVALKVETLVEGSKYRSGAVTMVIDENQQPCGKTDRAYVWVSHDSQEITTVSTFAKFQAELRALATHYEATCSDINFVWFRPSGNDAIYTVGDETANWHIKADSTMTKAERAENDAWRASAFKSIEEIKKIPVDPDHDLKNYGYYKAILIGKTPGFNVYHAIDKKKYGQYSLVVLHKVNSDDEPVFDVRVNGVNGGRNTGPVFMRQLEQVFKENGVQTLSLESGLRHYITGYHSTTYDRVKVMGPNFFEPPHFKTYVPAYWENGELFLSPYGSSLSNIRFLSRVEIIAAWGPSAPIIVADPLALPGFGKLPAEKPGEKYMARQVRIRQAAVDGGLIYKNDAYWSEFSSYETRRIFESYADHRSIGGTPFGAILMRYLSVNSQACRSTIKNPVVFKLDEITTKTNEWGASSTTTSNIHDMVVPTRFQAELENRFGKKNDPDGGLKAMRLVFNYSQPGGLGGLAKELAKTREWIKRSVSDVDRIMAYGECGNPVHQQFEEMLYQLTSENVPGDTTKLSFSNAVALSDSLYKAGGAPSLQGACVIDSEFGGIGNRTIRWCECVVDKVPQVKPGKVAEYVKRYATYNRDVRIARSRIDRGQEHPDNRLYSIQRYCAGQVD